MQKGVNPSFLNIHTPSNSPLLFMPPRVHRISSFLPPLAVVQSSITASLFPLPLTDHPSLRLSSIESRYKRKPQFVRTEKESLKFSGNFLEAFDVSGIPLLLGSYLKTLSLNRLSSLHRGSPTTFIHVVLSHRSR